MSSSNAIQTRTLTLTSKGAAARLPHAEFGVFEARPAPGAAIHGGIVLIQEIFGVNGHIRDLARRYAERGFLTWAPAYFDHIEKGVELGYDPEVFPKARELVSKLGWDQAVEDTRLTAEGLRRELPASRNGIATVGFCWGGSVAWLSATRLGETINAAVGYYGRQIWDFRNEAPTVPVLLHYGEHDHGIPMSNVNDVKQAHPEIPVYTYDAGHGFNCDQRKDFSPQASKLADERTMGFLAESLGFAL